MKKWGILIIGVFLVTLLYNFNGVKAESCDVDGLFDKTGAEFIRLDVEGHTTFKTDEKPEYTAVYLYKALNLTEEYSISQKDNLIELDCKEGDMQVTIKTRKMSDENLTYASINLSQYQLSRNINNNIRRTISKAFLNYSSEPSFSSLVVGKYPGRLSEVQMKEKVNKIFMYSDASNIQGINEDKFVSFSGFVPGIRDKIQVENNYINLNIALRYSETYGCTYIWIGSPIIVAEY